MARINLLPWRAERRKQRQKEFGVMLAFAALAGLALWFLVNSYYNGQISGQEERNAYLQTQISQVDTKIKEIRSEEHTSELQSLMRISYAVFCLKKKKTQQHHK